MASPIAIYTRYSSELQNDRSIEDQIDVCKDMIKRNKLGERFRIFHDRAISGSRMENRPGVKEMMDFVKSGEVSVVVSESMDRLSRDMEDMARIHKLTEYQKIPIITVLEGIITKINIGMNGTMNSMFLDQMSERVKRGQAGNINAGKAAGGLSYGYEVRLLNDKGEVEPGLRDIVEKEADIIRWMYDQYIDGASIYAILKDLNERGVPSPRGGLWAASTISGQYNRGSGILRNPIYKGVMVWNKHNFAKHPETGVCHIRTNDQSTWISNDKPSLQIIDTKKWEKVQDIFAKRRKNRKKSVSYTRLPFQLDCGHCNMPMTLNDALTLICSQAKKHGTCPDAKKVTTNRIKTAVAVLLSETHRTILKTWVKDLQQTIKSTKKERKRLRNKIDAKQERADHIVEKLLFGYDSSPTIQRKIAQVEDEIKTLNTEHDALPTFLDIDNFKQRPFSSFIKTSCPEAILGVIDSATVSFDDDQLLFTEIKPNWHELKEIMA
ncbi:MAG: recombinase family protein [Candidatus Puniceispirillales bacterium WSBS_2018_MAG_OTU23]